MDYILHRQELLIHSLWMMSLDPAYARWAAARYGRLPHLQGFAEEVEAELKLRFVGPPRRNEPSKPARQ